MSLPPPHRCANLRSYLSRCIGELLGGSGGLDTLSGVIFDGGGGGGEGACGWPEAALWGCVWPLLSEAAPQSSAGGAERSRATAALVYVACGSCMYRASACGCTTNGRPVRLAFVQLQKAAVKREATSGSESPRSGWV